MSGLGGPTGPAPAAPPVSVGRIVHWQDSDGAHLAAIVTEVIPAESPEEAELVALTVFPVEEAPFILVNVEQGTEPRQWHWPERIGA